MNHTVLLRIDRLELNSFICIIPPACGAPAVEVFFDVMPTETTDLSRATGLAIYNRMDKLGMEPDNHKGRAGSSGQRYPSPRDRAGILGLPGIDQTGKISGRTWTGHQQARRPNTHRFIVAPVRVLYAREDARLGLYRCGTGLENGGGQGRMDAGSGRHWLSICLDRTGDALSRRKLFCFNDTLTASDWEGDAETRQMNSEESSARTSGQKFPRSKSHGPSLYDGANAIVHRILQLTVQS
jgi:hypothetical protein